MILSTDGLPVSAYACVLNIGRFFLSFDFYMLQFHSKVFFNVLTWFNLVKKKITSQKSVILIVVGGHFFSGVINLIHKGRGCRFSFQP